MNARVLFTCAAAALCFTLPRAEAVTITLNAATHTVFDITIDLQPGAAVGNEWMSQGGNTAFVTVPEFGWVFGYSASTTGGGMYVRKAWPNLAGSRGYNWTTDLFAFNGQPNFAFWSFTQFGEAGTWYAPIELTFPTSSSFRVSWDVAPMVPDSGGALPMLGAILVGVMAVRRWSSRGLRVR